MFASQRALAKAARQAAREQGLLVYDGQVCFKNSAHGRAHYVCNAACVECHAARRAEWAERNAAKKRADDAAWRRANLARRRERNAAWAKANPEKVRESRQKWIAANPTRVRETTRRGQARRRGAIPADLTAIERARVQEFYDIAAARTAQTGEKWHVDHDKPLALGGLHHPDNLVLLPAEINVAKGARFASTFDFLMS